MISFGIEATAPAGLDFDYAGELSWEDQPMNFEAPLEPIVDTPSSRKRVISPLSHLFS